VITAVPDPGTYTLMLTGLGIMGFIASGKKRQDGKLLFVTQHSPDMAPLQQSFHFFSARTATPFLESGNSTRFSCDSVRSPENRRCVICNHSHG